MSREFKGERWRKTDRQNGTRENVLVGEVEGGDVHVSAAFIHRADGNLVRYRSFIHLLTLRRVLPTSLAQSKISIMSSWLNPFRPQKESDGGLLHIGVHIHYTEQCFSITARRRAGVRAKIYLARFGGKTLRSDTRRNKIYLVSFNLTVVLSSNRAEVDAAYAWQKQTRAKWWPGPAGVSISPIVRANCRRLVNEPASALTQIQSVMMANTTARESPQSERKRPSLA